MILMSPWPWSDPALIKKVMSHRIEFLQDKYRGLDIVSSVSKSGESGRIYVIDGGNRESVRIEFIETVASLIRPEHDDVVHQMEDFLLRGREVGYVLPEICEKMAWDEFKLWVHKKLHIGADVLLYDPQGAIRRG